MSENKLDQWVEFALKNEDILDYNIEYNGGSNQDDGYLGNIAFVTVSGKTRAGTQKIIDLVIKSSKENENFRKQFPIKDCFEKEIFIYEKAKMIFNKFQEEKGVGNLVDIMPYCFATQTTGKNELLALENLKPKGYTTCDRKNPLPFEGVKLILEAYGKWHALSIALKKQKPEVFNNLTKNNRNMFSVNFSKLNMFDYMWERFNIAKEGLKNQPEALKKLDFDKNDIKYILTDLFFEEPEYHVILHGDCWTNNFLFKFEENSTTPLDVKIIDFQCSGLASPVMDLSYFLYCCCSKDNYENLEDLLRIYHNSLSSLLKELGCNPEELYSFNTLMKQWKRFSRYGIVMACFILRFCLYDLDEIVDFNKTAERGESVMKNFYFTLKDENKYLERVKDNLLNYVKFA